MEINIKLCNTVDCLYIYREILKASYSLNWWLKQCNFSFSQTTFLRLLLKLSESLLSNLNVAAYLPWDMKRLFLSKLVTETLYFFFLPNHIFEITFENYPKSLLSTHHHLFNWLDSRVKMSQGIFNR